MNPSSRRLLLLLLPPRRASLSGGHSSMHFESGSPFVFYFFPSRSPPVCGGGANEPSCPARLVTEMPALVCTCLLRARRPRGPGRSAHAPVGLGSPPLRHPLAGLALARPASITFSFPLPLIFLCFPSADALGLPLCPRLAPRLAPAAGRGVSRPRRVIRRPFHFSFIFFAPPFSAPGPYCAFPPPPLYSLDGYLWWRG